MANDASPKNLRKFLESDDPALVRMGLSMVKDVCKFLENNDPTMRRTGLSMAKDCGVPEELWKNIFGLLMKDSENREAARELAEEIGMRWYLDGTRETLEKTGYWSRCLREHTVVWYRRRVEPLITVLGDEDWRIRQFAAETLGKIGDKRAVEPLIKALSDDHMWVRIYAVGALGKIGDERAVKPLITSLEKNLEMEKEPTYSDGIDQRAVNPYVMAALAKIVKASDIKEKENVIKFLENDDPGMVRMGVSMLKGILEE